MFFISQGIPQACILYTTSYSVFINDMLRVVEPVGQGLQIVGSEVSGLLLADDFAGDICYSRGTAEAD